MSGGKSYLSAIMFLSMAKLHPATRFGVFRRNMTALKRTTYQTFRKVAFEMGLEEKVDYTARKGDVVEWDRQRLADLLHGAGRKQRSPN